MRLVLSSLMIVLIGITSVHAQEYTAIVGGTVVHTHSAEVIRDAVVLIRGDRIAAVGRKSEVDIPPTARRIDAAGKYIIPGLIEGHMHFFQSGGLYTRPDGLDLRHRRPYLEELAWIRGNIDDVFRRYLACGITTVVDAGGPMWNFEIRTQAQNAGIAPTVLVAGPLIASYQPEALTTDAPPIIKVSNAEEALAMVRTQAEHGADLIKIWYVGSRPNTTSPVDFGSIVTAVVRESHARGLPVWVHATELELARASVLAGADVLVHSVTDLPVDDAFVTLLRDRGVILIPTLRVFESYAEVFSKKLRLRPEEQILGNPLVISSLYDMFELNDDEIPERVRTLQTQPSAPEIPPVVLENLSRLRQQGVTIAAGSDAGNVGVLHGPALFRDFLLMRKAGMTAHDILVSATLNGARLIRKEKDLGSIETGKIADLAILDADPLADIMNTSSVSMVFSRGTAHMRSDLIPRTPEVIAQIQLNAYNSRDLETFLSVYSDSVEVFTFPDTPQYKGKEQVREIYREFFADSPGLHCRLVDRMTYENVVIDKEEVTGVKGVDVVRAVAVYEIENGLIARVRFLQ